MRRMLTAALATTAGAGMVIAGVPAVQAETRLAPTVQSVTADPALAIETGVHRQTIRIQVRTTGATRLRVKVRDRFGTETVIVDNMRETAPGVWNGSGLLYNFEEAGAHSVIATATDAEFDEAVGGGVLQVRRGTFFSGVKAGPSPIRKGRRITVKGQLKGLNGDGRYIGYRAARVGIFFKKKGTSTWVRIAVVKTGRNGGFAKRFRAKASGTWKVQFGGNGTWFRSVSKGVGVRVR